MDHKEGTSSLIGVGIAVLANTLISAGLNVERLAHIRRSHTNSTGNEKKSSTRSNSSERSPLIIVDPTSTSSCSKNNKISPPRTFPNYSRSLSEPIDSVQLSVSAPPTTPSAPRRTPSHVSNRSTSQSSTKSKSKSKKRSSSSSPRTDKGFLKSPLWLLGFSLVNLGEIGNFLAYGFAPTSLVAPLGMTALVANVGLAPLIVGERFRKKDLVGIGICLLGGVTVVYASRSNDEKITPSQLLQALKQPLFLTYSLTSLVLIGLMFGLSQISKFGDRFVLIDLSLCAFVGAFTVLSTKALSSFLNTLGLGMFREPITYPLLLILLITAFTQVNFINKSLQRFESRIVIPTQYMTFSLWSVFGSAILYGDFKGMDGEKLLNFGFGCLVSAGGVYYLTRDDNSSDQPSEEEDNNDKKKKKQTKPQNSESNFQSSSSSSSQTPLVVNVDSTSSSSTSIPSPSLDLITSSRPHPHHNQNHSISISPTTRIILPSHPNSQPSSLPSSSTAALGLRPGIGNRTRTLSIGKYRFANGGLLLVASTPPPSTTNNKKGSDSDEEEEEEGVEEAEGEEDEGEGEDEGDEIMSGERNPEDSV
ncbi:hypothetical protein JCM5350_006416 [Sporobolomyces pararoseus]